MIPGKVALNNLKAASVSSEVQISYLYQEDT